ncbi:hypothetical protein ACROYT_G021797 [Oculina patagonica]
MTPRDGGFSKRPKLYISTLKLAGFAGSGVDISFKLRGGISTRAPKIVIFNTSRSSFLFDSFGRGVKFRMNPRDGGFSKSSKLYISSFKLAGFAGPGVQIRFNLCGGISTQGPKIVIFNNSYSTFLFYSFEPGVKIKMNPRDGVFSKSPKLYISSLTLAGFAGSGVKISFILSGGISNQALKILIFNDSSSTFLFDSFGPGNKIKMNPRDGGFSKRPKLYISSLKLAGFAGSEVKISFNLHGGISTQRPKIVIFNASCSPFQFDSFGPGMKIKMNPRDGGFSKSPKLYVSSLKLAGYAVSGVKISFKLRGDGVKIRMNPRDGIFSKSPKLYISSLKLAGFAVSGVKISFELRGGISTQGPKIVIFSGSCITFLFDSSGHGVKIKMNTCEGGFSKNPKRYISSLNLDGFAGSGVQIRFNLCGSISTQMPKIVIFSGSCITFLFDSSGNGVKIRMNPRDGVKIRMNPRDGGFSKSPKLYISSLKLAGFAVSGVKISFKLRGGISTQGPKIGIFSGSCITFLFDSSGHGVKIKMNTCDGGFAKSPKLYISSLKLAVFAVSGVNISFKLRCGIAKQGLKIVIFNDSCITFLFGSSGHGVKIRMNPCDGGLSKSPKLYISSLKLAGFAGSGVNITFNLWGDSFNTRA